MTLRRAARLNVPRPNILRVGGIPIAHRISTPQPLAVGAVRFYNVKAQPPGGTHRMNLGGEPEKPALEQYGVDLTQRAKDGKLDPVIGRDGA